MLTSGDDIPQKHSKANIDSNLSPSVTILDSTPEESNVTAGEEEAPSVNSNPGQGLQTTEEDRRKNKLTGTTPESTQTSDVKIKVKDSACLWEEKKTKSLDYQEVQHKRFKEVNVTSTQGNPMVLKPGRTTGSQASGALNDGSRRSEETLKPAKVSELVKLWSQF